MAIPDSLQTLLDEGVIDDVRGRLMSGKEAAVFVVEHKGQIVAAKVYKSREQRTFKATASYTEGRNQTRNTRDKRAMSKRTNYGKELIEKSWRDMEYEALWAAFHAGVRVPEPILLYEDVLLMELLVDDAGAPAPRLSDFDLPRDVAELLHREIFGQVRMLLAAGKIHGDLSAFNILIAKDGPTIIDLPQVVDAAGNSSAEEILHRDLKNVTEFLAQFDARLLRFRDCGAHLFRAYQNGLLEEKTEPQEGPADIGRGRPRGGRRERDALAGKMGRGAGRADRPRVDDGPPQRQQPQAPQQAQHPQAQQQRPRTDGPRPRDDRPRRDGPRDDRPRHDGPRSEQQRPPRDRPHDDRPRHDGPRSDQQRPPQDRPRDDRPRHDGPRPDQRPQPERFRDDRRDGPPPEQRPQPERFRDDRPRHDGPRHDGPRHDGPRRDGPRHDGPRRDGPRHDGPRHDGPRHDGPRPDGQHGDRGRLERPQPAVERRPDGPRRPPPPVREDVPPRPPRR